MTLFGLRHCLFLEKGVGTGSATGFAGYIYNSGKVNYTCANDVHRLPSVKDAMMIPMSSEALDKQLAEPQKDGFFTLWFDREKNIH